MTIEAEIQDIKEMLDDIPDDFAKYSTIIEMGDELEPYPEEFLSLIHISEPTRPY